MSWCHFAIVLSLANRKLSRDIIWQVMPERVRLHCCRCYRVIIAGKADYSVIFIQIASLTIFNMLWAWLTEKRKIHNNIKEKRTSMHGWGDFAQFLQLGMLVCEYEILHILCKCKKEGHTSGRHIHVLVSCVFVLKSVFNSCAVCCGDLCHHQTGYP